MNLNLMSKIGIFVIFSLTISSSTEILCNTAECQSNTALTTCADNESCNITCNGYQSCKTATLNCPRSAECNIQCPSSDVNWDVCYGSAINAQNSTKLTLLCDGYNACRLIDIYCPLTGDCNIQMNGAYPLFNSFIDARESTGNLNIESLVKDTSMSDRPLYQSDIYCPLTGDCIFNVYSTWRSLYKTPIRATDSDGIVNITVSGREALSEAVLYCPDAYSGTPNCLVRVIQDANDASNWGMLRTIAIRANRSFEQVSLDCTDVSDPRWCFSDPTLTNPQELPFPRIWCQSATEYCYISYVNGEYQCSWQEEASPCNIPIPNNVVTGSDFICHGPFFCKYHKMQCDEGSPCNIECNGYRSCALSSIQCPTNGACNINATGKRALYDVAIDCGITGDCTVSLHDPERQPMALNGANLNGSDLYLLVSGVVDITPCWDLDVHCPFNGDCNIIGCTPHNTYSDSPSTTNILTVNTSTMFGAHSLRRSIYCPAYSSTRNCFVNIIPSPAFTHLWMAFASIYADGGFDQLTMHMDPSLPNDNTNPTYSTHEYAYGLLVTCATHSCRIDYLNGRFQCLPASSSSACNVDNPDPIITGSNFTFDIKNGAVDKTFQCDDNADCYIKCTGSHGCEHGVFHCPENGLCYMTAQNYHAVFFTTLWAANHGDIVIEGADLWGWDYFTLDASNTTGDLTVYDGVFTYGDLKCPKSGKCHFQRKQPHLRLIIYITSIHTSPGTYLMINATDNLQDTVIYCPETDYATEPQCVIHADSKDGTYTNILREIHIYAKGGLTNDVSITCDYASSMDECYGSGLNPNVYCTDDYSASCNIELVNGFSDWECVEMDSICYNYAPQCTFLIGQPCSVSGDPHTTTWNGARHDYQGQPMKTIS